MIELCTKKRMIIGITLLGGLTILVLIVESQWTDSASNKVFILNQEHNATHNSIGESEILSCQSCIGLENTNKSKIDCLSRCNRVVAHTENNFLKFESLMLASAVFSCGTVFWRENILRRRVIRKVARQLRASV